MPVPKHLHMRKLKAAVKKTEKVFTQQDLGNVFVRSPLRKLRFLPTDSKYRCVDLPTLKLLLERNNVSEIKYVPEFWDCDNFAMALPPDLSRTFGVNSLGFVIDYSGGHAYNCAFVHSNGTLGIVIIEPQTDRLVQVGEGISRKEVYKAERGVVVL